MMNNTVRQPAAVETAVTAARTSKTPKEQSDKDSKFMNMLSDAINSKTNEAVKPPETAKEVTKEPDAATETEQAPAQTKPETEPSDIEQEDGEAYEKQAAEIAAAMQMQGMLPVITELPKVEAAEEVIAATDEIAGIQPVQTVQTEAAPHIDITTDSELQPKTAQEIPNTEVKTEAVTAEMPQTTEAAPIAEETAVQPKTEEATAPRTAQAEEAAQDTMINNQEPQPQIIRPRIERRQDAIQHRRGTASEEKPKDAVDATAANGEAETQTVRQTRPQVQIHQMRNPDEAEAAQTKFEGMLARASRELNPNAAPQEVQTEAEIPEEATTAVQTVNLEAKPQETAEQAEVTPKAEAPETETNPQTEAKQAEQAVAQKNVKSAVTEQRPLKEISRQDEALLGLAQQEQPEIRQEAPRSEPVQQQPQPQVKTPDQAEQIKTQVIRNMENQRTEFQMQLQPEELGKVNVKMVLEGGKLSVEISAVNPKSAEMLSKQAESLAASLKASGADVSSVNVVEANENVSAEMNGEYNLNNFQNRFQNRESGQERHGRSRNTGETGEHAASVGRTEREAPKAPQRILNYSV